MIDENRVIRILGCQLRGRTIFSGEIAVETSGDMGIFSPGEEAAGMKNTPIAINFFSLISVACLSTTMN